jgi:hypothetical protein
MDLNDHDPKPMTIAQTIMLTIKIAVVGAAVLLLIWLAERFQS